VKRQRNPGTGVPQFQMPFPHCALHAGYSFSARRRGPVNQREHLARARKGLG